MATSPENKNGLRYFDKGHKQLLFYKKHILKSVMNHLKEKRQKTLGDANLFTDKSKKVYPAYAEGPASSHEEKMEKRLTNVKSLKFKKIAVKDSIFDEDSFTLASLYDDWHNLLINIAKTQHKNAKCVADYWLEVLEVQYKDALEVEEESSESEEESSESEEESTDESASSENEEKPTDQSDLNFTWLLWLATICAAASLYFPITMPM